MIPYAIRTQELSRSFGTVRAVDQVSFEVPAGSIFGVLGPNGSGKTTTIRLLLGLLEPTHGRAEVLGFDTRTQSADIRQASGALLEHTGLYERMSAEDNLDFYARVWRMPGAQRKERIRELLDKLGLWERRRESVGQWSRGMKQKLALARVLLHRPRLIFLDEPTAGLDPLAAAALRDDLLRLVREQGVTVFLTTHNLAEAEKICDWLGVIREGHLLKMGRPQELLTQPGEMRLQIHGRGFDEKVLAALSSLPVVLESQTHNGRLDLRLSDQADPAALVQLLVTAGAQVEEVHKTRASLEEVFLKLMEEENAG